jgi:hypothetical protein
MLSAAPRGFLRSGAGKYKLHIPEPRRNSSGAGTDPTGTVWNTVPSVDFSSVYVANNETDTAKSINAKLSAGLHVVMAPGIYNLEAALEITKSGTVLLGLGIATLIPTAGTPVVTVSSKATGVRVAGLLLQAGTKPSTTLLQWGDATAAAEGAADGDGSTRSSDAVKDSDYGFIHDVNARTFIPSPRSVIARRQAPFCPLSCCEKDRAALPMRMQMRLSPMLIAIAIAPAEFELLQASEARSCPQARRPQRTAW